MLPPKTSSPDLNQAATCTLKSTGNPSITDLYDKLLESNSNVITHLRRANTVYTEDTQSAGAWTSTKKYGSISLGVAWQKTTYDK